jgi:hypothetical protein
MKYFLIAVVIIGGFGINHFFGTHPAVGEWKGVYTTTYEGGFKLDSSIKLSIFKDNRAIYEWGIVNYGDMELDIYSCNWSGKGVNFIELKCKNSSNGERIMTFKTENFSESGSLRNHNWDWRGRAALLSRSSK